MKRIDPHRPPLVCYHGACPDGFTAAWVVAWRHPGAELMECFYNETTVPTGTVTDRDVFIVDFTFPKEEMFRIANWARTLHVFDHHESAETTLRELAEVHSDAKVVFDMERSGAGITWDELFPDNERPAMIEAVEDRDLWRWRYGGWSRNYTAYLMAQPYTLEDWSRVHRMGDKRVCELGEPINQFRDQLIERIAATATMASIGGHKVPVVNCPRDLGSDVAGLLAERFPNAGFAAYYHDKGESREFGLRSRGEGANVFEVAQLFGGGGHRHAAGFKIPRPATL